ncbi:PDZ domain-containing protein [Streptomyces sp. NPDC002265]|uniref:PDZ domain-containing protein n=1 Tax=Streptomyces sp. NPDC002265 TaxID=3154415 RepID=UPI003333B9D5
MEETALRPKPMPGRKPPGAAGPEDGTRRPRTARRRGRRLTTLLSGLLLGTALVLSGVGLGTVGATVISMGKLAELQRRAAGSHGPGTAGPEPAAGRSGAAVSPVAPASLPPTAPTATLGVEAVDAGRPGALVVGVHVPGPGYRAGLVRGDVLLAFGRTRIGSAADLAHAVARARPGREVTLTVRHHNGGHQRLRAVPGVVT